MRKTAKIPPPDTDYLERTLKSMREDPWWVESFGRAQVREWIYEHKLRLKMIRKGRY